MKSTYIFGCTLGELVWKLGQIWFTVFLKVILEEVLAKRMTTMTLTNHLKMIRIRMIGEDRKTHLQKVTSILPQKARNPII
uniref:Uncharacterized protein n=1 Tax=Medicago truncatula TaxID=3880 RepID=B7FFK7_MEDTR|nr:unknown [Medicago truncatula]